MWPFKMKKDKSHLELIQLMQLESQARVQERDQVIELLKSVHKAELKTEYYKGYGYASAEIYAAMRKSPNDYIEFVRSAGKGSKDLEVQSVDTTQLTKEAHAEIAAAFTPDGFESIDEPRKEPYAGTLAMLHETGSNTKRRTTVYVDGVTLEKFQMLCKKQERSVSEVVETMMADLLLKWSTTQ